MDNVVTPKEMALYDKKTIDKGTPSLELMERAGEACFKIIKENIIKEDKILVVCGTGNNGGDGQVIARLLKEDGYNVNVLFTASEENFKSKMSNESLQNFFRLQKLDVKLYYAAQTDIFNEVIPENNIVIDAVFGTGLDNRPMSPYYQALFKEINENKNKVIAIDIPSGLNGTNGKYHTAIKADITIIIQAYKTGELLESGPDLTGKCYVVDIGINTAEPLEEAMYNKKILSKEDILFPAERLKNSHKYHYGSVLIIAGSRGMLGAASLASHAALRSGAGLVVNFVPDEIYGPAVSIMPPEALVEPYLRILTKTQLENFKKDAILFGPGLGKHNDYSGLVTELLDQNTPIVIDADGLWMMHYDLDVFKEAKAPVIITPHHGEFSSLLGITVDELKEDPIHYAALFAQEYEVTVVLKGHHTLIASPDGQIWFNMTGNPGMATPGSGDVLAGMTAAMLAQVKDPLEAAKSAVYFHGLAGDIYADTYGETTLVATDIINSLKFVLR